MKLRGERGTCRIVHGARAAIEVASAVLWAPRATPKEIIARLNEAVVDALSNANVRSQMTDLSQDLFPREQLTPEGLTAHQKAEIEKWWPIMRAAAVKAE